MCMCVYVCLPKKQRCSREERKWRGREGDQERGKRHPCLDSKVPVSAWAAPVSVTVSGLSEAAGEPQEAPRASCVQELTLLQLTLTLGGVTEMTVRPQPWAVRTGRLL